MPSFNSFDFFQELLPVLLVLAPLLAWLGRGSARRAALAACGTYLLYLIAPRLALVHLALWCAMVAAQQAVARTGGRKGGLAVLWVGIVGVSAPLVVWKIWPARFVTEFNYWGNRAFVETSGYLALVDLTKDVLIPVGLSFATFRAVDLLVKSNLGLVPALTPGRVLGYGLFPSLLVVGPIAEYEEVEPTLERRVAVDTRRLVDGGATILTGLAKVFVFSYLLKWSQAIFVVWRFNTAPRLWAGLVAFGWFFYLNFSGYSDIAVGAARLLGADVRPNFDSPYTRTSPTAFWANWHISLTNFLRRNVFLPITGGRARRQVLATTATMVLIALWHAVTWATLLFGLYHAASLVGHRWLQRRRPPRSGRGLRAGKAVAVFVWYVLSLPLLMLSLHDALSFYRALVLGGRGA